MPVLKVGLLLPNSNMISRLAGDIRQWFGIGLRGAAQADFEFVVETTAYNESGTQVRAKIQDLLIKHEADLIVAPLNPGLVRHVADLASGQEVPIIVLTMGEDVFLGDTAPPWIFVNSFGLWRSMWIAGYLAVQRHGANICTISAAHEGGYGMGFAFALGVEVAGGTLQATLPLPLASDQGAVSARLAEAVALGADAVLCACSGSTFDLFQRSCEDAANDLPLIALSPSAYLPGCRSPMAPVRPLRSVGTWAPDTPASAEFIADFHLRTERAAHAYALLAYEAGLLIAKALSGPDFPGNGRKLAACLLDAFIDGPRGRIGFDPTWQEIAARPVELLVSPDPDGAIVESEALETVPPELEEQVAMARKNMEKQGWLNPYLVA